MLYTAISIIILFVCVLLILVVLVQNSKGGGLASNFSSSNQVMGVRRTTDFLEKATWTLASSLVVLSIVASMVIPREVVEQDSRIKTQVEENESPIDPSSVPFPSGLPDQE